MNFADPKKFIIYCSGRAGRVLRFYSNEKNQQLLPKFIVYDGTDQSIQGELEGVIGKANLRCFRSKSKDRFEFSDWLKELMKLEQIDYMLCFGNKIIRGDILFEYHDRLINFHPSLLPSFPGLNSIDQALAHGAPLLGNTVHLIDAGVDTGRIIAQSVMRAKDYEEYEDVLELQFPLLKYVLENILGYRLAPNDMTTDLRGERHDAMYSFQ